jgi:hypothetical protein
MLVMAFVRMLLFRKVTWGWMVTEVTCWPCLDDGKVGVAKDAINGLVF